MCLHHAKCREREDLDMVPDLQELCLGLVEKEQTTWRVSQCHLACRTQSGHKGARVSLPGRLRRQGADAEPGPESTEEPGWGGGTETHSLGEGQLHNVRLGLEGGLVITASRLLLQLRRKRPQRWPLHQSLPPVEGPEVAPAPGPQCDGFSISRRL